jgi:hypothetical protein
MTICPLKNVPDYKDQNWLPQDGWIHLILIYTIKIPFGSENQVVTCNWIVEKTVNWEDAYLPFEKCARL